LRVKKGGALVERESEASWVTRCRDAGAVSAMGPDRVERLCGSSLVIPGGAVPRMALSGS
jgi:hypothetical protein